MKAVCKICGKEFEQGKHNQKYCSKECRWNYEKMLKREKRKEAAVKRVFTCRVCGKEFTPIHGAMKCCSDECAKSWRIDYNKRFSRERYEKQKAQKAVEHVVRKCELCGKEFTVGRMKKQRFCSTICNKRAYRLRQGAAPRTVTVIDRAQLHRQKLMQEVIDAQRGPIEELYEKSKKWNKEQRDFAKARYMKIHFGK